MAGSLLLTSDSTGSSQNITSTLELATRTAAADEWVVPSVRLSSLNGAAATITLTWRHYASNGTTLIREQAYSFAKPQTASTVAGDDMPAVFLKSGEKLTIAAKSSNASDNSVSFTISWANAAASDLQQVVSGAVPTPAVTGVPIVDWKYILGTILTESGAGRLAARLIGLLDVTSNGFTAASALSTYAGADTSGVTSLLARLTATRAGYLDNLTNLDAAISSLNNLSALVNLYGSPLLEIPDSSSTDFAFTLVVRDNEGKLVDLDSSPTIAAANAAGTDRSANLSAVSHPATGRYTFTYSVSSAAVEESLRIACSGTVSAEGRYIEWVGAVVNYDTLTTLAAVKAKTDLMQFDGDNYLLVDVLQIQGRTLSTAGGVISISNFVGSTASHIDTNGTGDAHAVRGSDGLEAASDAQAASIITKLADGTIIVGGLLQSALAQFVTDDTGETEAAAGSVAALSGGTGGGGSGSGARTVTITVNDGSTVLENARVRLTEGASTYTWLTNSSGVAVFNVDDATYTVAVTKAGYSFAGTTLVVNGTETATYSMTSISVPTPSGPGRTVGYGVTLDELGNPVSGVTVEFQLATGQGEAGLIWSRQTHEATSGSGGSLQVDFPQGASYRWRRPTEDGDQPGNWSTAFDTGTDDAFELPELLGAADSPN